LAYEALSGTVPTCITLYQTMQETQEE